VQAGGFGLSSQSAFFDNFDILAEGSYDDLRFYVNTDSTSSAILTFDVAHAPYDYGTYSDSLEVLVSSDCGATFTRLYRKGGLDLETAPAQNTEFTPSASQWRSDSVSLGDFLGENKLIVVFRNIGRFGNSIFVDNVNLTTEEINTALDHPTTVPFEVSVYPNPAAAGSSLRLILPEETCRVTLFDLNGKKVTSAVLQGNTSFLLPLSLLSGRYLVHIQSSQTIWNKLIEVR
jgi:hypothetical protein